MTTPSSWQNLIFAGQRQPAERIGVAVQLYVIFPPRLRAIDTQLAASEETAKIMVASAASAIMTAFLTQIGVKTHLRGLENECILLK